VGSIRRLCLAPLLLVIGAPAAWAGSVLDHIRMSGRLDCGIVAPQADWDKAGLHGDLSAFGAAFCKAVAIAATGHADALTLHRFATEPDAFSALGAGTIALAAGVTPDIDVIASGKASFSPPIFYDVASVMVRRDTAITELTQLRGKKLCTIDGTKSEAVILHALAERNIAVIPFSFQEQGEMESGFLTGHCQALGAPSSLLWQIRATYANLLRGARILPQAFGIETAATAYAPGDSQFAALADATRAALIKAEAAGMTAANAQTMQDDGDPLRRSLLGIEGGQAAALGVPRNWATRVVASVGNFGEIFARSFGSDAARGVNRLWRDGGAMTP
jgi:general L-amino acid transport system substrate-binding protein